MYEPTDAKPGEKRLWCAFPLAETQRPEIGGTTKLRVVDFVWQTSGVTWLVEIKDPERTPEPRRSGKVKDAVSKLRSGDLAEEHLLPKLFGTYAWMTRERTLRRVPHRFAALVAMPHLDAALRIAVTDHLQCVIDEIGPLDRATGIAPVAEVHDLDSWNALDGVPAITREP